MSDGQKIMNCSVGDRTRTCGPELRRFLLYPLSYTDIFDNTMITSSIAICQAFFSRSSTRQEQVSSTQLSRNLDKLPQENI